MKRLAMFMIAGVLALGLQACGGSTDNVDGTNSADSMNMDNNTGTEGMGMDTMGTGSPGTGGATTDTTGMGDINRTDTTGTGRPGMTP